MRSGFFASLPVLILVVACGGDAAIPIATYPYPRSGMFDQARLDGVLIRQGNCLYVASPAGESRHFVVFPEGVAAWEDGALVIDGRRFSEGDTVAFSGGEGWSDTMIGWVTPPDDECDLSNVWRASHPLR